MKVVSDNVSEQQVLEAKGATENDVEAERQAQTKRQQSWVTKRRSGEAASWRPRKRHRKDSWLLLVQMDHQLREGAGIGSEAFRIPPQPSERPVWSSWPYLSISCDQGSVEESAKNYAQQQLSLNLDDFPDPGHGVWNDVKLALRRSGLWPHTCMMMLVWNVPHGPWSEDRRYGEVLRQVEQFLKNTKVAADSWLFMQLLPRMLFDLQDQSLASHPEAAGLLFQRMVEDHPLRRKGAKISMNRFMSAIKMGDEDAQRWTQRYFFYLMTSVEQDYLHGRGFEALMAKGGLLSQSVDTASRTTSSRQNSHAEGALIRACQNQLSVATVILGDVMNQFRQRLINMVCSAAKRWFEQQAHQLRSVGSTFEWLSQQLESDFFEHLCGIMAPLGHMDSLRWVGFSLPSTGSLPASSSDLWHEGQAGDEDQLATEMAQLALHLVGLRLQRCMHMIQGYSCRSIRFLHPDGRVRKQEVTAFKSAFALHQELVALGGERGVLKAFAERSQFNLLPVQQLVEACKSCGWHQDLNPEVREFVRERHHPLISTQTVEDEFQRQKRQKYTHHTRRLRVASAWGVLIDREVDRQVHRYERPPEQVTSSSRAANLLPESIFSPPLRRSPLDLGGVTSHSQTTSWYSPSAERHAVKFSDVAALSFCKVRGCMQSLPDLWLSFLVEAGHCLLLREVRQDGAREPPIFALISIPGGVALGWPAEQQEVPGGGGLCWVPSSSNAKTVYLPIVSFAHSEAIRYRWRSPLSQWLSFPQARGQCASQQIRAFADGSSQWEPLLTVCAKAGFWAISSEKLTRLCKHIGIGLEEGSSTFDIASKMVQHILECSEEHALEHLRHRIVTMATTNTGLLHALLALDEEAGVLDKADKEDIGDMKEQALAKKKRSEEFVKEWSAKKKVLTEARSAQGGGKGAARKNGRHDKSKSKYPALPPDLQEQKDLKRFCPPGGYLWRGLSNGSWQCHYPPWQRGHYSWDQWGASGAAKEALKHLWRCHLAENAKAEADCPVEGLFAAGAVGNSQSSSSKAPPARPPGKAKAAVPRRR